MPVKCGKGSVQILARVKVVHDNRRVTRSRVYIIQIFNLWDQFNISRGRAAIVFIALLIYLQRVGTAEASLTVRQAIN